MVNRLANAISPYLRSHADNPVDWFEWGSDAFAAAAERDVPVLVSIGYSTCHWCHVMARESFSDPAVADVLNRVFVAIKVDREEHPEVDASYLAAASAFTPNLGWPLNVFVTPEGKAFFAGTYSPPVPVEGHNSFGQVLTAVSEAWSSRRDQVTDIADRVAEAIASAPGTPDEADLDPSLFPGASDIARVVAELPQYLDPEFGGFGAGAKFPVAPALNFALWAGAEFAPATLRTMAGSPLRDVVEGGFFRYSVNRDWSEPHYERMLYDNAQLLTAYSRAWQRDRSADWARDTATGIAGFLVKVLRRESGAFGSAQDSESTVDGTRTEGTYYSLNALERREQVPPAVDDKVLTGWNGLAISALATAGAALGRADWIVAARQAADSLLAAHVLADGRLVRASLDGEASAAASTLEDYGMFAGGLLDLAAVTGEADYAIAARRLLDAVLEANLSAPGGGDPVLGGQGLLLPGDPSEGAYPSGVSATAAAFLRLAALTADRLYRSAARRLVAPAAAQAMAQPVSFGATLTVLGELANPERELVVVTPATVPPGGEPNAADDDLAAAEFIRTARAWTAGTTVVVSREQAEAFTVAGFTLFEGRSALDGQTTAYLCTDSVCTLPVTTSAALAQLLAR